MSEESVTPCSLPHVLCPSPASPHDDFCIVICPLTLLFFFAAALHMQMLGVLVRVLRVFSGVHDLWHEGVAEESHGEQEKTVGEGERQRALEGICNFPSLPKVPCPLLLSGVRHRQPVCT